MSWIPRSTSSRSDTPQDKNNVRANDTARHQAHGDRDCPEDARKARTYAPAAASLIASIKILAVIANDAVTDRSMTIAVPESVQHPGGRLDSLQQSTVQLVQAIGRSLAVA